MKRVGVNSLVLNSESGGLGVYIVKLIEFLLKEKLSFEPRIFLSKDTFGSFLDLDQNGILKRIDILSYKPIYRVIKESFIWPGVLKENKIDLLHSPISYIPFGVKIPSIITIHDLGFFHYPENYTSLRGRFLVKMIAKSIQKAEKIIAISEFTKHDLVKMFDLNEDKVRVIYSGLDKNFYQKQYSEQEINQIKERYRLPDKYILSVGHLEPRKNYVRLIKAYNRLVRNYQIDHSLVIVGRKNWKFDDIFNLVDDLKLNEHIVFTEFVNNDDLPAIYQNAEVFVAPSLFEGFGFTPLESMAAGTPVAASDCTAIPEIVGDAGKFFDPYDVDDITEKVYNVLCNKKLQQTLIKKGLDNIKRFNWQECCTQIAEEYDNMLTGTSFAT